ncbi:hypothetical protein OERS_04000 [Oerskovia enterophila]|uniref:GAF domain-containing protein n=1 Tax=Oerskovia enterophila TaxID=43678 RepID=A0ABX2Y894_9CELL|nr:hypothetical protein OERS_04000 [Oerskovia enterophila]
MALALRALLEDMSVDMSKARVSIYRHHGGRFILVARVSQSQSLKGVGRSEYPDSEGVIGRTWDRGSTCATGLPEARPDWDDFCVREYGMDPTAVRRLKMQSRSLLGMRIESATANQAPVGLLMIESLAPRGVNGANLDGLTSLPSWPLVRLVLQEVVQCLDDGDVVI